MNAENRWIVVLIGRRRHRRQRSAKLAECVEEREREMMMWIACACALLDMLAS